MTELERGILLLCCDLGEPTPQPMTTAQFLKLGRRINSRASAGTPERAVSESDLTAVGYGPEAAARIVQLLGRDRQLEGYLEYGRRRGIVPLTRLSEGYPRRIAAALRSSCPPVLFCAGDLNLLTRPAVALVGSRALCAEGRRFAREAGRQAALQGYTLVSGGASGADTEAQEACLDAGGTVIAFVADCLLDRLARPLPEGLLYVSEGGYAHGFSAARALSRNRFIHIQGEKTLVAQTGAEGGTFSGTAENLAHGWSPVFVQADGTPGAEELIRRGAVGITLEELCCLQALRPLQQSMFEEESR